MSDEVHLLNVRELIELLTALTPEQQEMPVWVEGCDCAGPAITVGAYESQVLIERAEQIWDDETDSLIWRAIP